MRRIIAPFVIALLLPALAVAQERQCTNERGEYDPALSADWQDQLATSQPTAMAALSGRWHHQFDRTDAGDIEVQVQVFHPDGLFEYRSRVCTALGTNCSENAGHGVFTAHDEGDGLFVAINFSDNVSAYRCLGLSVRFADEDTFETDVGRWTRVK